MSEASPTTVAVQPPRDAEVTSLSYPIERISIDPRISVSLLAVPELGNSSYLVSLPEEGKAIVVDPFRDVRGYLQALPDPSVRIVASLETHVHNDFVSGGRELAALSGTDIVVGQKAPLKFPHRSVQDGETIALGPWSVRVLATPGHTPEHVSYVLRDPEGKDRALFSGGALIVGGAARTDLLGIDKARSFAHSLYQTITEKLQDLPGDVRLLPTHGGGSFCGAIPKSQRTSTMAEERKTNPLLTATSYEDFLNEILEQGPYPEYFHRMRALNTAGVPLHGGKVPVPPALTVDEFDTLRSLGAAVIDTRDPAHQDRGHVPESYTIPGEGPFSSWVGWLLPASRPILLVSRDEDEALEAARQLFRIGYDNIAGSLEGGFEAWRKAGRPVTTYPAITETDLMLRLQAHELGVVLDVREAGEWHEVHIPASLNLPLQTLPRRLPEIPRGSPIYVYASRSYRATIASGILEQGGLGGSFVRVYEGW